METAMFPFFYLPSLSFLWYKKVMEPILSKPTAEEKKKAKLEKSAEFATKWIGSTSSLIFHTVFFIACFILPFFGIPLERMLLVLTTAVSLEAIYLAIFIQMSVNKNTADIEEIQEDVDEIQEDIEEIGEDVDEIQKDVDEIQEDVDEIQKDVDEIQEDVEGIEKDVDSIQKDVDEIQEDIEEDYEESTQQDKEFEALASIQAILTKLQSEIEQLKKK
jgi:methyl-accepting chemotaxis protein